MVAGPLGRVLPHWKGCRFDLEEQLHRGKGFGASRLTGQWLVCQRSATLSRFLCTCAEGWGRETMPIGSSVPGEATLRMPAAHRHSEKNGQAILVRLRQSQVLLFVSELFACLLSRSRTAL